MSTLAVPFRLVGPSDPKVFPMACLCGNARGLLVDTLMDRNPLGRVYLCDRCFGEIARLFDVVAKPDHDLVQARLEATGERLELALGELASAAGDRDRAARRRDIAEAELAGLRSENAELKRALVEQSHELHTWRRGDTPRRVLEQRLSNTVGGAT